MDGPGHRQNKGSQEMGSIITRHRISPATGKGSVVSGLLTVCAVPLSLGGAGEGADDGARDSPGDAAQEEAAE